MWDAVEERHAQEVCSFLFSSSSLSLSLASLLFSIQTKTNLAIQVKEAAEKAMEEYKREAMNTRKPIETYRKFSLMNAEG